MKNQWHISQRHSSTQIQTFIPTWSQLLPYSWQCQCQLLPPNDLLEWCAQWRRTYDENRATRSLALMHVYRDIPIDVKALIHRFCAKKKGRLAVEFLWVPPRFQMFATNVSLVRSLRCWCCWPQPHLAAFCSIFHYLLFNMESWYSPINLSAILHQITSQSTWIFRIFREGMSPDRPSMSRIELSLWVLAPPWLTNKKCLGRSLKVIIYLASFHFDSNSFWFKSISTRDF